MPDEPTVEEEAVEIMERCLDLSEDECRAARWRQTTSWDSFAHVELIVEVEERYAVELTEIHLARLVDFEGLVGLLETLRATNVGYSEPGT